VTYLKVLSYDMSAEELEKTAKARSKDSLSPARDMNSESLEYTIGVLTTRTTPSQSKSRKKLLLKLVI
jgi:hypothetical protein